MRPHSDRDKTAATAIESRWLSYELGGRLVLDNIDLCIKEGQTIALWGPNGAGKTTLLRCLAGLIRPTFGEVLWFGEKALRDPSLRRSIGMVAHQRWLYRELTPRENLLFGARLYGIPNPKSRVEELLGRAGLRWESDKPTSHLSHGMRQRVSVCRALVHDPPVLLLDEPFSGLDDESQGWLTNLLRELHSRSRTICFTTHKREVVQELADCILYLERGKLRGQSTSVHDLCRREVLREAAA